MLWINAVHLTKLWKSVPISVLWPESEIKIHG